jgi:polar amino acid transport system substrate-binding protein
MQIFRTILFTAAAVGLLLATGCSRDGSKIRFAGSGGYPPFNFVNEEDEVIGFDVDVAREVAQRLNKKLVYKTTAWDGIIEGLRAGRYDGILGSMAITDAREKVVDFSVPYYYSGPQVIVRQESEITSLAELDSSSVIGLVTGTTFEKDARELGVQIKYYEDDNQTLMELLNGRLDAAITDRVVGLNAMKSMKGGDELMMVDTLLRTEACAVAVQEDATALRRDIDQALVAMHEDGTLSEISAKWFNGQDITKK